MSVDTQGEMEILLVESRVDCTEAVWQTLTDAMLQNALHVVGSGEEALDFLYQRGKYQKAPRPHVIILDLDISGRTRWAVFAEIKADPSLREIPVIIQTVSKSEGELLKQYNLGDHFIVKPVNGEEAVRVIRSFEETDMSTTVNARCI